MLLSSTDRVKKDAGKFTLSDTLNNANKNNENQ